MSRIGKKIILLSPKVKVKMNGNKLSLSGPLGESEHLIPDLIHVDLSDSQLSLTCKNNARQTKAIHGLTRSIIANKVKGVETGYLKELQIEGIGFRAQISGKKMTLALGFSHPVEFIIPNGIKIEVQDNVRVKISGIDKQQVGQVAAIIRNFKQPEPYKGKGIRYAGEVITLKEGKTV